MMKTLLNRSLRRMMVLGTLLLGSMSPAALAGEACEGPDRYTFSWSLAPGCDDLAPRGGTTRGTEVTLATAPHPGWQALQEEGLSARERDRRAILAMAGPYRTSFEFLEVVGYTPDFERSRPYHSWSTEYVYVVEDRADFVSLQHILVMFIRDEEDKVQGPFVQKHWRQDWEYEQPRVLTYIGEDRWRWQKLTAAEVEGAWVQSVYQVDDSPRYAASGHWQHSHNLSTWRSATTWRPLPRRESSVRDDYDVLEGWNRHTITPTGWVHEEENYKLVLNDQGIPAEGSPYLAKELGVNRYERIEGFDFSAGDDYWEATAGFWAEVRLLWAEYTAASESFRLQDRVDGEPLFALLFMAAERWREQPEERDTLLSDLREQVFERYLQQE